MILKHVYGKDMNIMHVVRFFMLYINDLNKVNQSIYYLYPICSI